MPSTSASDLSGSGASVAGAAGRSIVSSSSSVGTRRGRGSKLIGSCGASSGGGAKMSSCKFSTGALGSGVSLGLPERAEVATAPIFTVIGRRDTAGPSARNVPRARSRMPSAWRRSMPSRSAARAMSMSRKVRPIRKLDASAATFLASLARRCVAITPARPRLRPRHIRLVIALSDARRTSSATSPPVVGANNCASSTTTSAGYQCSRGASNNADRKAAAQRICPSASSPSRLNTTLARCSRRRVAMRAISGTE